MTQTIDFSTYINGHKRLAVAVSGGSDSMALCYMMYSWLLKYPDDVEEFHIITVDHGLRPESKEEAKNVKISTAFLQSLPLKIVHQIIERNTGHLKDTAIIEEARHDRYDLMMQYCKSQSITALFVAHHRDDQAETFLYRLAKGSGIDGLSCMKTVTPYHDGLCIIRPLLGMPKSDLVQYCHDHSLSYVSDPTNHNIEYMRPRLREARSVLEKEGLTNERVARTAERMRRSREALDFYTEQAMEKIFKSNAGRSVFDFKEWLNYPEEIRLRCLQRGAEQMRQIDAWEYNLKLFNLEKISWRMAHDESFRAETLGGLIFRRSKTKNEILITKEDIVED